MNLTAILFVEERADAFYPLLAPARYWQLSMANLIPSSQLSTFLCRWDTPSTTTAATPRLMNPGAAGALYSMSQYISPFLQVMSNFCVT